MKKLSRRASLLMAAVMCSSVPLNAVQVFAQGETQSTNVIDVTDFGADPTGIKDSQPAVMKAIEAAREAEGSVTISFPEGTYNFYPEKAYKKEMYLSNTSGIQDAYKTRTVGICIEDMENVVVDGNGSRFIFHNKMTPYASIKSTNVTFQNFSIDFAAPTCYELLAEERDNASKSIIYHIPESNDYTIQGTSIIWKSDVSPYTGQPYWTQTNKFGYTQEFDSKTGEAQRNAAGVLDNVASIEDLGNNLIKITYSTMPAAKVTGGYVWETRNTTRDQVAAALLYSKNVSLKNIHENYVHGFGMIVQMCDTITLDGVIFDTPDRSGRATSSSADDINISGVKGMIEIKNSRFHNPHDDPINVHGTFLLVKSVDRENKKVTVAYQHNETSGFPNYFAGDRIEFSTKGSLVPISEDVEFTVVKADGPDGFGGQMGDGSASKNEIVLTLDKEIPEGVTANQALVENISYTPDVYIHDNVFDASPTRGILCTTRGQVRIENNVFDRMNMAAIFISCDGQSWYESGRANNISIKGNTFIRSNSQDIFIEPTNPSVSVDAPVHHNITIEDNTFFKDANTYVLDAKSTQGLTFRNNKILRTDPFSSLSVGADQIELEKGQTRSLTVNRAMNTLNKNVYRFNGSKDIVIDSNQYDPGIIPGIDTANGTNASHIQISNDAAALGASRIAEDAAPAWISSDPEVAEVENDGTLTARKAGQAVITSYIISGGRRFEAGKTTVTVTETSAGEETVKPIIVSGEDRVKAGETLTMTASGENLQAPVRWKVLDPATGIDTNQASIDENGVLSTQTSGVVLVGASSGSSFGYKAVAIYADSYDLSDDLSVAHTPSNQTGNAGLSFAADSLTMIHGQRGLYQEQSAPYVLTADLPEGISADNVTATVKATSTGSGDWGFSGLYLFKDQDNYISTERKNRGNASATNEKMAAVREASRSASEHYENGNESAATVLSGTTYWYRISKTGTKVSTSYSEDGETFKPIAADLDGAILGDSFKIALSAGETGTNSKHTTFSDLTVSSADSTENAVSIPLVKKSSLAAPADASLSFANNELKVSASAAEGAQLIRVWEQADTADGPWSITTLVSDDGMPFAALNGKYIRAQVYQVKDGAVSEPTMTNAVRNSSSGTLIIGGKDFRVNAGETAAFTARFIDCDGEPVSWKVLDPQTREESTLATVSQDGVLTAVHGGVVLLEATGETLKAIIPVIIQEDTYTISSAGTVAHQGNANAMSFGNGTFSSRPVGQGIYQEQNASSVNMVQYALPVSLDHLETITVKANGYVPAGSNVYREVGLFLMKDDDNYVSSSRKTRPGGVKNVAVREVSGSAAETWEGGSENAAPNTTSQDIWLRIEKLATGQFKALYSTDGTAFTEIGTVASVDLGDTPKIGLAASGGNANEALITYSDLQVNGQPVEMTSAVTVESLHGVTASLNDQKNGVVLAHDVLSEGCSTTVVWGVADEENGNYTIDTSLKGETPALSKKHEGKYLKALVFVTKGGAVSLPVESNAVYADALSSVINPAETTASSEARLKSASLDGSALSLNDSNWFTVRQMNQKTASIAFEALDPAAKMTVTLNKKAIEANGEIQLQAGYNLVDVHIEAPDGVTIKDYRLQIFRNGDGNDNLSSLTVNGQSVEMKDDGSAAFTAPAGVNTAVIQAAAESASSTVKIYTGDGKLVDGATALETGDNQYYVVIQTETLKAQKVIPLTIRSEKSASILLESAQIKNSTLNPAFDPYVDTYKVSVPTQVFEYSFSAKDPESAVRVYMNDSTEPEKEGVGELTWTGVLDMTKETNTLRVEVISKDQSETSEYVFNLKGEVSNYLSDFTWSSATSGDATDNPVRKDLACNGGEIKVLGDDGTVVTWEKGIGVHANSDVVIDLTQKEGTFTTFEAVVGIDHNTAPGKPDEYPKIVFTVYGTDASGNERVLAASNPMMYATPAQKLSADLDGIVSLRLHAESAIGNVWNAHADWADAKVLSTFDAEEEQLNIEIEGDGTISKPSGTLYKGQMITVEAQAAEGYTFKGWKNSEDKTLGTEQTLTFRLGDAEYAGLKAVFAKDGEEPVKPDPVVLDYTLLDEAAAKAEKVIAAEGSYKPAGMDELKAARDASISVRNSATTQKEIDDSAKACGQALLAVRLLPSDEALGKLK